MYLNRIGIAKQPAPTEESLRILQRQHQMNVPFENLGIHTRAHIDLDVDALYRKIVTDRRGGVCYELNSLYGALLRELGFDVRIYGAVVPIGPSNYFDHLMLLVKLGDDEYITDVGFGSNYFEPKKFTPGMKQHDARGIYRIAQTGDELYALQKSREDTGEFTTEYEILLQERKPSDFRERADFITHSPHSVFLTNVLCSLEREDGRVSVTQSKLTLTHGGKKETLPISSLDQYFALLKEHFDLTLDSSEQDALTAAWQNLSEVSVF